MDRRHFLQASLAGTTAVAASLSSAVPLDPAPRRPRHLILLWMDGGPSHMDLWDIKEGSVNQGDFKSIATAVPGIRISELLPLTAMEFRNLSIIRSLVSRDGFLQRANYRMTHVFPPNPFGVQCPGVGAVVGHFCGSSKAPVPRCVALCGDPGFGDGGFLGPALAGFPVDYPGEVPEYLTMPALGDAATTKTRTELRREVLELLDGAFTESQKEAPPEAARRIYRDAAYHTHEWHKVAWDYTGRVNPDLFRLLDQDNGRVQERFGDNRFGRGCFLAARLVKAGAAAVSVTLPGWEMPQNMTAELRIKAAELDRGFSGLMTELRETGLLAETVVLWAGPFGRTPRINARRSRDPWANGWSVVLGGCGMGGVEYGQTDKDGISITKDPVTIEQLFATIYTALGIDLNDRNLDLRDELGRRYYLTGERENARPIKLN